MRNNDYRPSKASAFLELLGILWNALFGLAKWIYGKLKQIFK